MKMIYYCYKRKLILSIYCCELGLAWACHLGLLLLIKGYTAFYLGDVGR